MNDTSILTELADGVATITINRPPQLNALNEATRVALSDALAAADANPDVRAVMLTGTGRAFCLGQDLSAVAELEDCQDCVGRTYNPVAQRLAALAKPVLAAVNGPAVGAGMAFALGCDLVMMAEAAFLSCVFGEVGLIPDSGATYYLARALGHRRAFEIAMSGRRIGADEAVALELANRVVAADRLPTEAQALAAQVAGEPANAMMHTKRLLRRAADGSLDDALSAEAAAQGVLGRLVDYIRLRAAFLVRSAR